MRVLVELPAKVLEIAEAIRTMKIRGAGRIARAAAEALMEAAKGFRGTSADEFMEYMRAAAITVLRTRPTAVSLPNAVAYVMVRLEDAYRKGYELAELVETVVKSATEFIEYSKRAVEIIGRIGANLVEDGYTILTHCNSSAAIEVIIQAHKRGKRVKAVATETRPRFQGYITARKLREAGVPVTLIPDSAVRVVLQDVDMVVVGADAIAANGALVNKIGTSLIALAAAEAGKPFYTAAETYKFSPATLLGDEVVIEERAAGEVVDPSVLASWAHVKVRNPSFDITPPECITAIITEQGIIPPHAAYLVLRRIFGKAVEEYSKYVELVFTSALEE